MNLHSRLAARPRILIALALVAACVHGVIFHLVRHYLAFSTTVIAGVVLLAVIQHLGVIGSLFALVRRRSQKAKGSAS